MGELLVVTTRWPFGLVPEFLDREIHYLADAFDSVTIAPMRPTGVQSCALPPNVRVDLSLAGSLAPDSRVFGNRSRQLVAARNLVTMAPMRSTHDGFGRAELARPGWVQHAMISRADSLGVYRWARTRVRPALAYTFWLSAATLGLRYAWRSVPLVTRAHGGDVYAYQHGWETIPQQRSQIVAADLVACVSQDAKRYLGARFPDRQGALEVRHLGVADLGGLAGQPSGGPIRVLSASSIDSNKRVDLIAASLGHVAATGREVEWTHFGDGPDRRQLEEELRSLPTTLKVELRGHVGLAEVHAAMFGGGYQVFVNLSRSEGVPVSVIEAQCVGLSVVATNVGGTSEAAPPQFNELVPADSTVTEISRAILRAASSGPLEALARRAHWAAQFEAERNYSAFAAQLANLAHSQGAP